MFIGVLRGVLCEGNFYQLFFENGMGKKRPDKAWKEFGLFGKQLDIFIKQLGVFGKQLDVSRKGLGFPQPLFYEASFDGQRK